ncbi:hypothetical protein EH223_09680 [candidate division KSB1 bacterium]|nr:hypothetical protein [Candidatus Aminicenantes bacterium]RQW03653.1 MAG: hypothetical protein EH223_09680 [candidate division KSB1 bacterium]
MKRTVLPVAMLLIISVITAGIVIGASSEAKDPTTAITHSPSEQSKGVSGATNPRVTADPVVTTIQLTPLNHTGNWRHPAVGEDSRGNRLVIFRGPEGNKYYYVYCTNGGTWSAPKLIADGNQPLLHNSLYANIKVDSSDRFHCTWEDADGAVYASFRDDVWSTPTLQYMTGEYDLISSALDIRSDDTVLTADCEVNGFSKDIFLHSKGKNDTEFGDPFNMTRDVIEGSTQPCIAVDSKDNTWLVWKSDLLIPDVDENLVIYLAQYDVNNNDVDDWMLLSTSPGWSFVPQVAVNSEDKVMSAWAFPTGGAYSSRLFDPATKTMSPEIDLGISLLRVPWHTFFIRMASHDKDFFVTALTAARTLPLMKFDETTSEWNQVAECADRGVEMHSLFSGYDNMLIAWNSFEEPTGVFLTTVSVPPYSKIRIKSVSNLVVVKQTERGFFTGYTLNALTWEANPENAEKEITVTAHRVYRKGRTEPYSEWERIAELAADVFKYGDRNIPANSDYVYAVTCVDDEGKESSIN